MCEENEILVSVICLAYNHKEYIKKALDGFIMQKTDFRFEVIIHDDASEDGTADIIKEYAEKYPDIIVPILQTENQYSKGGKGILATFVYPRIRGKYTAFCEGDDYWIDEYKLQKQIDFLEAHNEYSVCVHAHKLLNVTTKEETVVSRFGKACTVSTQEIIEGDGSLFATNSVVGRTNIVVDIVPFREKAPVGDYPLMIHFAFEGKVYYMPDVMSCYRYMVPGSWSSRVSSSDEKRLEHIQRLEIALQMADEFSNRKFHNSIIAAIQKLWFYFEIDKKSLKYVKRKYNIFYEKLNMKSRLILELSRNYPYILKILLKIKRRCQRWKKKQ